MYENIAKILEDLPEDMNIGESKTPSGYHLITVNEDNPDILSQ